MKACFYSSDNSKKEFWRVKTFVGTRPSQYRLELRQDNFFSYQPNFDAFLEEENLVSSNASAFRIDSDNSRELKRKLNYM